MAQITDRYHDYEKKTIKLQRPIKIKYRKPDDTEREEVLEELVMREPDAGDLESINIVPGGSVSTAVLRPVLAVLTGQSEETIRRLKIADFTEVAKAFADFTPDGLGIGGIF